MGLNKKTHLLLWDLSLPNHLNRPKSRFSDISVHLNRSSGPFEPQNNYLLAVLGEYLVCLIVKHLQVVLKLKPLTPYQAYFSPVACGGNKRHIHFSSVPSSFLPFSRLVFTFSKVNIGKGEASRRGNQQKH